MEYPERLRVLDLPSLTYRRQRGDMIEVYKYTHGLYNIDPCPFQLDKRDNTRGHAVKLQKRRCFKNSRMNFFTMRAVNTWNRVPDEVVDSPTINTFKNRIDKHWVDRKFIV